MNPTERIAMLANRKNALKCFLLVLSAPAFYYVVYGAAYGLTLMYFDVKEWLSDRNEAHKLHQRIHQPKHSQTRLK